MLYLSDSPATRRLVKLTTKHLTKYGWGVSKPDVRRADVLFGVKRELRFRICCIDAAVQTFVGTLPFTEYLERDATEHRLTSLQKVIYVINEPFIGLSLESLTQKGIVLIAPDELQLLTEMEALYDEVPDPLDRRKLLIAQGCTTFCITLSDKFQASGAIAKARFWLELATDWLSFAHQAHHKLVDLHIRMKDYDEARKVLERALLMTPRDVGLLKKFRNVENIVGNSERAAELEARITSAINNSATDERVTLESILAKQKSLQPVDQGSSPAASGGRESSGFFRRLFVTGR